MGEERAESQSHRMESNRIISRHQVSIIIITSTHSQYDPGRKGGRGGRGHSSSTWMDGWHNEKAKAKARIQKTIVVSAHIPTATDG